MNDQINCQSSNFSVRLRDLGKKKETLWLVLVSVTITYGINPWSYSSRIKSR
jgi:hypothetical protein